MQLRPSCWIVLLGPFGVLTVFRFSGSSPANISKNIPVRNVDPFTKFPPLNPRQSEIVTNRRHWPQDQPPSQDKKNQRVLPRRSDDDRPRGKMRESEDRGNANAGAGHQDHFARRSSFQAIEPRGFDPYNHVNGKSLREAWSSRRKPR